MQETITYFISKEDIVLKLEGLTREECYDKYGLYHDETITHTIKFSDDTVVDIKCIVGEDEEDITWYEGVLFKPSKEGYLVEVGHTDIEDSCLGEWYLEDQNGNTYTVLVEVKE